MAKSVAFSSLLLDTSCELYLPIVQWSISTCTIFAFRSPTKIFLQLVYELIWHLYYRTSLSHTQSKSPHACKSCGPNALLHTVPLHSIQSLELLQQEHCICVISILIDYLWTKHIPSNKIRLTGLITFPWSFKFSIWFPSSGFLTHIDFQGEVVGFSPTLFCMAPTKRLCPQ
jgi:hypothetical protein